MIPLITCEDLIVCCEVRRLRRSRWLQEKETDSVRLWRKKVDYQNFHIDFAPFVSFDTFMNDEPVKFEED